MITNFQESEDGTVALTLLLMVAMVLASTSVLAGAGIGIRNLELRHEAAHLAYQVAAVQIAGGSGCAVALSKAGATCTISLEQVEIGLSQPASFWFTDVTVRASARVGFRFPSP